MQFVQIVQKIQWEKKIGMAMRQTNSFALVASPRGGRSFERYIEVSFSSSEAALRC